MGRVSRITSEVKRYDAKLFCEDREGKLCIYRETTRIETYHLENNVIMHFARPAPYFVFALTDTWRLDGKSVDWGLEPIRRKLIESDLWKRDIVSDLEEQAKKSEDSSARDVRNHAESFFLDQRSRFAKATNDINVSTLEKRDLRSIKDKSIKG